MADLSLKILPVGADGFRPLLEQSKILQKYYSTRKVPNESSGSALGIYLQVVRLSIYSMTLYIFQGQWSWLLAIDIREPVFLCSCCRHKDLT